MQVYSYEYVSAEDTEIKTAHVAVPSGMDAKSYIQGRIDEMSEGGTEAFHFKPAPEMQALDIFRTLASGSQDIWREFYPSKEAARASWLGRVGDYVISVEIKEAAQ